MGWMRYVDATQHLLGTSIQVSNPWPDESAWGISTETVDNAVLASMVNGVKYMRDGAGSIRQATAQEVTDFGGAVAVVEDDRKRTREKEVIQNSKTGRLLRALAEVMMDEINVLRSQHALSARTLSQVVSAIESKLDAN